MATPLDLNEWLKKGRNSISIQRESDKVLYIKMCEMNQGKVQRVSLRRIVERNEGRVVTVFCAADVDYKLSLFNESLPAGENTEAEIRKYIVGLNREVIKHNGDVSATLRAGMDEWMKVAYGGVNKRADDRLRKFIEDRTVMVTSMREEDVKIIVGRNAAMVYHECGEAGRPAYLFKYQKDGKAGFLPPLYLMRKDGAWMVWK
jgi:hypothetical protein